MVFNFCSMRLKHHVNVNIPECYREQLMAEACESSNGYVGFYQQGKRRVDEVVRSSFCFSIRCVISHHLQAGV